MSSFEQPYLPLTSAQNNVWFHQLINPDSPAYNIGQVIRIDGAIELDRFEKAQNMAWEASDSLRSHFAVLDGNPVQIIAPYYPAPFELIDLSADPCAANIKESIQAHQLKKFDLFHGPCCRFALFKISEVKWIWSMAVHHLVVDAPGGAYFAQMIAQAYRDLNTPLLDTSPSWVAAIEDDIAYRQSDSYIKDKNYWLETLSNLDQTPSLNNTPVNTLDLVVPENAYLNLSRDDYSTFFKWSTENGQGAYAGFVASILIYLNRLTGISDLCIGSPTSGRSRKTRSLVGMLANAIPLRLQIQKEETSLEILKKAAKQIRQGLRHNSFPIGELTQDRRQMGLPAPFSIIVNLLVFNQSLDFENASGLAETLSTGSVADIQLNIFDRCDNGPVELRLDFNPARYSLEEAQNHLSRIALLIKSLPLCADLPIADLTVINQDEKEAILESSTGEANQKFKDFKSIIDLFNKQVIASPQNIALTYEDLNGTKDISYESLDKWANALAHHLIKKNIGADDVVAIFLDRSAQSIVSMLAVLKTGAAYLPIDPEYPASRQGYMLENSAAKVVITDKRLWGRLPSTEKPKDTTTLFVDDLDILKTSSQIDGEVTINPKRPLFSSNLAYLIYTSGSTGKPKGAGNTHAAIINRLLWMQDILKLGSSDAVLQKTGVGFDVAVWEWFLPLMTGARLIITKPDGHKDPLYLESMISRFRVTTLHFVPSMLSVFLSLIENKNCHSLKNIVTSGEALSAEIQNRTLSVFPGINLWNLYGPTEAAIDVSFWRCSINEDRPSPPIGLPIWNTELLILDESLNLVPNKCIGELYISGANLSRGYLNASGLTSQRFIANPHATPESFGDRMYRTGDLVWRDDDGAIMYIGRIDDQIKIRGFRIELGEIEATILNAFPEISQVIVQNNGSTQDPILVAYIVSRNKFSNIEVSSIESKLLLSLPEYMVPRHYIPIEEIPFTQNGKIDRKALPNIDLGTQSSTYMPPRSTEEACLCRIYAELCQLDSVGINDDFFRIGGHSLLAMRLIGRISKELNITVPLRTLFDHPTPKALSSQIALLGNDQAGDLTQGIGKLGETSLHLSYGQIGLWALDQVEGPSATYNMPSIIEIQGEIDVLSLKLALRDIVDRHQPLRTTIQLTPEGLPYGALQSQNYAEFPVEIISIDELDSSVEKLIEDRISRPFLLDEDCLLRAHIFTLSENHHLLLLNIHHIASDGHSRGILFKELGFAYNAYIKQETPSWPELKASYADWAIWQQKNFEPLFKQKIISVKERLKSAPETLDLPLDYPRKVDRLKTAKYSSITLPIDIVKSLEGIAYQYRTSLFTVLLSAYGLMLHGISSQKKVTIGIPASGRNHHKVEDLIGIFINMLPVSINFEQSKPAESLISQVQSSIEDALIDQDLPFEKLIEEMNVSRSLGSTPIFQTIFSYQSVENISLSLEGASCSIREAALPIAKYDLSAFLSLLANGEILINFEFDSNLFKYENIQTWINSYQTILKNLADTIHKPLAEASLLNNAEKLQIIKDSKADINFLKSGDLLEKFTRIVDKCPTKTALSCSSNDGAVKFTYEELDQRSNQLASYLTNQGIQPNSVVGLLLDRSPELIIAILAILKTGSAYLPLDPDFPVGRIQHMLKDSNSSLLITKSHLLSQLSTVISASEMNSILIDDAQVIKSISSLPLTSMSLARKDIHEDMLAYILYTSGSTGLPKGVCITRKALTTFLDSIQAQLNLNPEDKMLALTTIGFDISGLEIFLPLLNGSELLLANDTEAKDPRSVINTINNFNATYIQATPSMLSAIEAEARHTPLSRKPVILSGGEALPKHLADALLNLGPLVNLYGPTEATIWASIEKITVKTNYSASNLAPIGEPLSGYSIYILNANLEPVPHGVTGEIFIAGDALARGYHNRPGLTAERFIANPFNGNGDRMYRTGDIGRKTFFGSIEFIGRADDQVKIRGHRIELGEIESAILTSFSEISEATVVVREIHGENYLVAYIVVDLDCDMPASKTLKDNLAFSLPGYMIPDYFMELDSFPLTPNGKINRKALPLPVVVTESYKPPSTELEIAVCKIFSDLTKREHVGIEDNFFSIGGHSLLAMRLISTLRKQLGIEISLKAIFKGPTPSGILSEAKHSRLSSIPQLKSGEGKLENGGVTLSYGQVRLWTLQQLDTVASTYNVPAAIRIKGKLDIHQFEKAFTHVIKRHESLRTLIDQDQSGNPIGKLIDANDCQTAVEVRDLKNLFLRLSDEQKETTLNEIIQTEVTKPFNLDVDLPIRSELIQLAENDSLLLVTMHHHISDGRSSDLLIAELNIAYEAYLNGEEVPLPEITIQYSDWAVWQRNSSRNNLDEKLTRIKERLEDAPEFLTLPLDHKRLKNQIKKANHCSIAIPPSKTAKLLKLAQEENTTLFSVVLSIYGSLLSRLSNQDTVVIGSPVEGRGNDLDSIIGFMVNTLVFPVSINDDVSARQLIQTTKKLAEDVLIDQEFPFDQLVEHLGVTRSLEHTPVFQAMLAFQNKLDENLSLKGLECNRLKIVPEHAKFDINLNLVLDQQSALVGYFEYDENLFNDSTIKKWAGYFDQLIDAFIEKSEAPIITYSFLKPDERTLILASSSGQEEDLATQELVFPNAFSLQASLTPNAIALEYEIDGLLGSMSYKTLEEKSNQFARFLLSSGVKTDEAVAVLMKRSPDLIVTILGILKAGAAYLPLDISYPFERLSYMLTDSKVKILITENAQEKEIVKNFTSYTGSIFKIDDPSIANAVAQHSNNKIESSDLESPVSANNLVYIMYTSGSTGEPKGVGFLHGSLMNLIKWQRETIPTTLNRVLQYSPIGFDASAQEIAYTLSSGATLILIDEDSRKDFKVLLEYIEKHSVQQLFAPFVVLNNLAIARKTFNIKAWPQEIYTAGEQLQISPEIEEAFLQHPNSRLHNFYGPTEAHVVSNFTLPNDVSLWDILPPIGYPIFNTQLLILDKTLEPIPQGMIGELYLGGVGLARGYLNRPGMTASKFMANPFAKNHSIGELMYRTGDLVRRRDDGSIEFLGRVDQQIKLRGFRIEPGEIESVILNNFPEILQAVVLPQDRHGDTRLVAYLVCPEITANLDIQHIRAILLRTLPEYMVPTEYAFLDSLPLTSHGKLDKRKLPEPSHSESNLNYCPPETAEEKIICSAFSQLIGVENVGVNDNFFSIGGHSLLAMKLIANLKLNTNKTLTLRNIFEFPTPKGLSQVLASTETTDAEELLLMPGMGRINDEDNEDDE